MKKGMDPASAQQGVEALQDIATNLSQLFETYNDQVQSFEWTGEDGDAYKTSFASEVGEIVTAAVDEARRLEDVLIGNIEAQNTTSSQ